MALRLPLTFLLASAPLAAQDYSPDLPRIEALTALVRSTRVVVTTVGVSLFVSVFIEVST